jgi:hypothetical protein
MVAALAIATIAAVPASAAKLLFTIENPTLADFQFTLDDHATPFSANPGSAMFLDVPSSQGPTTLTIFGEDSGGGLSYDGGPSYFGDVIYTGDISAPVFTIGVFSLFDPFSGPTDATLTVTLAPVPEPAAWAMMLAGFGITGAAMRRRSKATVRFT